MEKIDFIRKCIELADGFEYKEGTMYTSGFGSRKVPMIYGPNGAAFIFDIDDEQLTKVYYPLLIRLAAEALEDVSDIFIKTLSSYDGTYKYQIDDCNTATSTLWRSNPDWTDRGKAITAALEYIFEQEEK